MFKGVLEKLKQGLSKTRGAFRKVKDLFTGDRRIDDGLLEELEELLITSDIGLSSTTMLIARMKAAFQAKKIADTGLISKSPRSRASFNSTGEPGTILAVRGTCPEISPRSTGRELMNEMEPSRRFIPPPTVLFESRYMCY